MNNITSRLRDRFTAHCGRFTTETGRSPSLYKEPPHYFPTDFFWGPA